MYIEYLKNNTLGGEKTDTRLRLFSSLFLCNLLIDMKKGDYLFDWYVSIYVLNFLKNYWMDFNYPFYVML